MTPRGSVSSMGHHDLLASDTISRTILDMSIPAWKVHCAGLVFVAISRTVVKNEQLHSMDVMEEDAPLSLIRRNFEVDLLQNLSLIHI